MKKLILKKDLEQVKFIEQMLTEKNRPKQDQQY